MAKLNTVDLKNNESGNVEITIELISPIAMEKEVRFAIREGGRTIGSGVVTEVIE